MKTTFTPKFLDGLKSRDGKEVNHTDAATKGLAFRVSSEQRKTFRFSYTFRGERRLLVWLYPAVTLEKARKRVADIRQLIADGKDPEAELSTEPDKTVEQVVDLYLESVKKKASAYNTGCSLKNHVVPLVGKVLAKDFNLVHLNKVTAPILARDAGVQANRVQADLKRAFQFAASKGVKINRDWLMDARRPNENTQKSRDVWLERDEIKVVWKALDRGALRSKLVPEILKLLLITGQRNGEVSGMRRSEIDLENKLWRLPGGRVKNRHDHVVPLSPMALSIIQKRLKATTGPFLFPNGSGKAPVAVTTVCRTVLRAQERGEFGEMKHWTPHDFRRTLASHLEMPDEFGVPLEVREAILNHVKRGIVGTYNKYQYQKEKRAALDKWSDFLLAQMPVKAA